MRVDTGIDVLLRDDLGDLSGAALGLLTGASGVTADLVPTVTALHAQPRARLHALFGAEHGVRGDAPAGEHVASGVDETTGLPVHSLYGETRQPTDEMLRGLDAILVDLQDAGLRYYTYPATVRALLQAAAGRDLLVVVLDRPNPLSGAVVEGPLLEPALRSFVGAATVPVRHGLTLGELAGWINEREGIAARLRVVAMDGWRRDLWFDETGLPWVPPSPNIPTLDACLAYTATGLIEGTNVSEGRGTAQPFSLVGAPWIDSAALAGYLNALALPGVRWRPTWFRPTTSKHSGRTCAGVQLHVTDRARFQGVRTGLHLLAALRTLYPREVTWIGGEERPYFLDLLLGTSAPRLAIERGDDLGPLTRAWNIACAAFADERRAVLLY